MNRKSSILTALCTTASILAASLAYADASSQGKIRAYSSSSSVAVNTGFAVIASNAILKGKAKNVVEVEFTMIDKSNITGTMGAFVRINGIDMEPSSNVLPQQNDNCTAANPNCTLTSTYWVDLDALEASYPGQFKGQPLTIIAYGRMSTAGLASVSLRSRMVKK